MDHSSLTIVFILTVGFALAAGLAYFARKLKLPAILGYLIAGFFIGPYSPGFVADYHLSEQLAEIGVVLMLFGVGLHFNLRDLINVQSVAVPGAVFQTLSATAITALIVHFLGGTWVAGTIIGLSIGVASTVVLVRVLTDNNLLNTKEGHIAVGWLIVEDIFTVVILILLPTLASVFTAEKLSLMPLLSSVGFTLVKLVILFLFMFTWGYKIANFILTHVARLRSQELFTLTILALLFVIAIGSTWLFGTSIALGAFIAGMVVGKTNLRHQAAANALHLKDIFAVIFFLSVGMLFNPKAIVDYPALFLGLSFVVLFIKPLSAFLITVVLGHPIKVALTVAVSLAQIGEFSFILAEQAMNLRLVPDEGFDSLVAVALLSISLNPLLFNAIDPLTRFLQLFWRPKQNDAKIDSLAEGRKVDLKKMVIVGFGPIGRKVAELAKSRGYLPVIIETNVDTVADLEADYEIKFGDATELSILEASSIEEALCLFITIPGHEQTFRIIDAARELNPTLPIVARVRYISELKIIDGPKIRYVCSEKEELEEFLKIAPEFMHQT